VLICIFENTSYEKPISQHTPELVRRDNRNQPQVQQAPPEYDAYRALYFAVFAVLFIVFGAADYL
jgi:hypothetical protein